MKRTSTEAHVYMRRHQGAKVKHFDVSNVIYHKFSHGAVSYTLNGETVNVMLEYCLNYAYRTDRYNRKHITYLVITLYPEHSVGFISKAVHQKSRNNRNNLGIAIKHMLSPSLETSQRVDSKSDHNFKVISRLRTLKFPRSCPGRFSSTRSWIFTKLARICHFDKLNT